MPSKDRSDTRHHRLTFEQATTEASPNKKPVVAISRLDGVRYVKGTEGLRMRYELAAVIRDLLEWAATARHSSAEGSSPREDGRGV